MFLTSVRIKNFRSLHSVDLQRLKQFNVLIGKNNSGKSAFFAAIRWLSEVIHGRPIYTWDGNVITEFSTRLFLEIELEFRLKEAERAEIIELVKPQNERERETESAFARDINFLFKSLPGKPETLFPAICRVRSRDGGWETFLTAHPSSDGAGFTPNASEERTTSRTPSTGGPRIIGMPDVWPIAWAKEISIKQGNWPFYFLAKFLSSAFFFDHVRRYDTRNSVGGNGILEQDGRNLVQVLNYWSSNHRFRFEKIQSVVQKAFSTVGTLETPFTRDNQPGIHAAFRSNADSHQIPLQHMGGGVAQMLMAAVVLETTSVEHPIFIEEPETNIHPGAQRFLAEQLCEKDRQIFITTHSPTFINLQRPKSVHKVTMANGRTSVLSLDDETLHTALSEIGARNSDVLLSDAVVFVEGESDLRVIQAWCDTVKVPLAGTNTSILPMHSLGRPEIGAPLRSETLKQIASNAAIPHLFILDGDELSEVVVQRLKKELGANLHIFERREIENYLLHPSALRVAIEEKLRNRNRSSDIVDRVRDKDIEQWLMSAAAKMKQRVLVKRIRSMLKTPNGGFFPRELFVDLEPWATRKELSQRIVRQLTSHYTKHLSNLKVAEIVKTTRTRFERDWRKQEKRLFIAPGAELIEHIFKRFDLEYDKTADAPRIAKAMHEEHFAPEIRDLLQRIRNLGEK